MAKAIKFLLSYFNIMPTTFIKNTWLFNVDIENINFPMSNVNVVACADVSVCHVQVVCHDFSHL